MDGGASEPSNEGNARRGTGCLSTALEVVMSQPQRARTAGCELWEGRKRIGCYLGTLDLWMDRVAVDDQLVERGRELIQLH